MTRPALSALLNERAHLSAEMALRIEKAFGASMGVVMRMQSSSDIAEARERESEIKVDRFVRPALGASVRLSRTRHACRLLPGWRHRRRPLLRDQS